MSLFIFIFIVVTDMALRGLSQVKMVTDFTKFHEDVPLGALATASLFLIVVLQIGDIAETAHWTRAVDDVAVCSVR